MITICEKCGREVTCSVFGWRHLVETHRHRPKPIEMEHPTYKNQGFATPLLRSFLVIETGLVDQG